MDFCKPGSHNLSEDSSRCEEEKEVFAREAENDSKEAENDCSFSLPATTLAQVHRRLHLMHQLIVCHQGAGAVRTSGKSGKLASDTSSLLAAGFSSAISSSP